MDNPFIEWLSLQLKLQQTAFVDPRELDEEARATFLIWNAYAAEDEIHEAMSEVGWKPWATSRHMNTEAFLGEIVDALHFIGNMVLAAAINEHESPETLAKILWHRYQNKVQKNIDRQAEGYDGVSSKCPQCHREMSETNPGDHYTDGELGLNFCTYQCKADYRDKMEEDRAR